MPGGVGGGTGNRPPYPDVKVIVFEILEIIGLVQRLLPLLLHPALPGGV